MTPKNKKRAFLVSALLIFVLLIIIEVFHEYIFTSEYADLLYPISTRFLGGAACMIFICVYSSKKMLSPKTTPIAIFTFLPCMLIAVNNFPFITFFSGEAYVDQGITKVLLYAILCLGVGFFEEMAFRGCIFSVILSRRGKRTVDVFFSIVISSVIFGIVHIVNLFAGASPGAVFLQIGYSFLIGGMCSVILIKTSNIWYCVFLHAVYNFAGGVVPECGGGAIWTLPTVILTAAVAVPVAVYVIWLLVRIKPHEIDRLLNDGAPLEQTNKETTAVTE